LKEEWNMNVGTLTVDAVRDGQFVCPVNFEYPEVEASRWGSWRELLTDGDKVVNEFGSFLVRGGDRVVLVDLGFGPAEVPDWKSGELLRSLAALGVEPEQVTDVLLTHLHFDHIGWATVGGQITFPNATYRCHEKDWPHFMEGYEPRPEELTFPAEMLPVNKLAPVADRMEFFSGAVEVIPGIEVIETPGHSPGHCSFRVVSQGEAVVLAGDIAHHQAEFVEPGWQGVADDDEELARRSRRGLAEHLAETGTPFVAAHFRDWQWGRVTKTEAGLAWEPVALVASS
jgi:glyoxylase-like metal-dependent hydrolase (beta-lactamase superfamily II)